MNKTNTGQQLKSKGLNFIESAAHNSKAMNKSLRNLTVAILVCSVVAGVCRVFFWGYTDRALVTSSRYTNIRHITDVGWPATLYTWGGRFAIAFIALYIYYRYKQDLKMPSFGVTDDGVFINQQTLYNAFVPWNNIQKAELLGPVESPSIRLTFKNTTDLLKGQPFLLKSIAKAYLKDDPVLNITKDETIGDIRRMHDIISDNVLPEYKVS